MTQAQTYPTHVYWDSRDNGFIAIAPDLPGCSAFGDSREDALKELDLAIKGWIETAKAAGEPVPEPSRLPKPNGYSGKVLLRMPTSLHEKLAWDADAEGVSLNHWLVSLLSSKAAFQRQRYASQVHKLDQDVLNAAFRMPLHILTSALSLECDRTISPKPSFYGGSKQSDVLDIKRSSTYSTGNAELVNYTKNPTELSNG